MVGWSRACGKLDRESEEIHQGDLKQLWQSEERGGEKKKIEVEIR